MLALDPDRVRLDLLPSETVPDPGQRQAVARLVLDRGVTWPWTSDDPALSTGGVIGGDLRKATPELGQKLLTAALDGSAYALKCIDTDSSHGTPETLRRHHAPHA
jgi:creatinine amidohydrolase